MQKNEPLLSPEAIEFYWDRAWEFVLEQIVYPYRYIISDFWPSTQQKALLKAVSRYDRLSVESGHGTGKSTVLAWIIMWWLATRMNSLGRIVKVPIFAPTYHQIKDVLWPELKRWIPASRLHPLYIVQEAEVYVSGHKEDCFGRARSPSKPDAIQGFHAEHLLVVADEAFGITSNAIWETIEGYMTTVDKDGKEGKMIIGGQHTTISGYVHDTFGRDADFWFNLRFNSLYSSIASKEFVDRMARKYGRFSDVYRVRVEGKAPKGNPESFFQLMDVEAARNREVKGVGKLEMGVDCARFGDDMTVITIRHGFHVFPQVVLPQSDTDDIVNKVLEVLRHTRKVTGNWDVCRIKVDATGGWGAGTIDTLRKNTADKIAVDPVVITGEGNEWYGDTTTVMAGELRDVLSYVQLPDDDFLCNELSTRRKQLELDSRGREKLESKTKYKAEYEDSPDRFDSLLLCFANEAISKRVLSVYTSTNEDFCRNFKIKWDSINANNCELFCVMIHDDTLGMYAGFYFWGRKSRELRIYDEIYEPMPVIERLILQVQKKIHIPTSRAKMYANDKFFKKGKNLHLAFVKRGINLLRAPGYDESASIVAANAMFYNGQIIIHRNNCRIMSREAQEWKIRNGRPEKTGYPLVRTLLLVVDQLRASGELEDIEPSRGYQRDKAGTENLKLRKKLKKWKKTEAEIYTRRIS